MKNILTIVFYVFFWLKMSGVNAPSTFKLTDTSFSKGSVYIRSNVLFRDNVHEPIRDEDKLWLDSLALILQKNRGIILEIASHSDQRGSDSFNLKVTRDKSLILRKYLQSKGIPTYRLIAAGYGEKNPLNTQSVINNEPNKEKREELYRANRRTVFRILCYNRPMFELPDTIKYEGQVLRCPITYKPATKDIDSTSFSFLDSLSSFIKSDTGIHVRIEVHVDSRWRNGSHNITSERGNAIATYLINSGVLQSQIQVLSYMKTAPLIDEAIITSCPDEEAKEAMYFVNRRTEIRITSMR